MRLKWYRFTPIWRFCPRGGRTKKWMKKQLTRDARVWQIAQGGRRSARWLTRNCDYEIKIFWPRRGRYL